ncbi:MAG: hypothetical protein IKI52_06390 [Clostridia bacterium]|nr:hypothetical protein [Clostridia bacterium]
MKRLLPVLLAAILLCGCLPTPETDAVVNRGEEDLSALIQTTPAPDAVTVRDAVAALPQSANAEAGCIAGRLLLTEETDVGGAALAFDADVIVPDLDRWAVYAVDRGEWNAGQRLAVLNAAADGAQICAPGMYLHADKAYWEGVLKTLENSERVHELDRSRAENGEQTWTESVMEYYRTAPQSAERIPFDETKIGDAEPVDAFWFDGRMDAYLDFYADASHVRLSVFDRRIVPKAQVLQDGGRIGEPSLTLAEAVERAQAFLSRIGFADAAFAEAETAQRIHMYTLEPEATGWRLVFRKQINGVAGIAPRFPEANPEETYAEPWPQEIAELYIDRDGIWSLDWQNPAAIAEPLSESTAILDFDTVLRLVRARLRADNGNADLRQIASVCVTKLRLGYCIVPQKDAPDRGWTLPVWIADYEATFEDGRVAAYSVVLSALNGANLHLAQ